MEGTFQHVRGRNFADISRTSSNLQDYETKSDEYQLGESRDRLKILPNTKEQQKCLSKRCVRSSFIIVFFIAVVVALVVLGVKYIPRFHFKDQNKCGTIELLDQANALVTTDNYKCPITEELIEQISFVRIYSDRRSFTSVIQTNRVTTVAFWEINVSSQTKTITATSDSGNVTCNDEGTYSIDFFTGPNATVPMITMKRTLTIHVNNTFPNIKIIPYLVSSNAKALYVECSMMIGCRHGTLVPELIDTDGDVSFVDGAQCDYVFTIETGGVISCSSYVNAALWTSSEAIRCSLNPPPDDVHLQAQVTNKTASVPLEDVCKNTIMVYQGSGEIECKRAYPSLEQRTAITIDLYKYSPYVRNQREKVLTLTYSNAENAISASDGRIVAGARMLEGNVLQMKFTFSPVYCSDEGTYLLRFQDGSEYNISVTVQGNMPSCQANVSYSITRRLDISIPCAICAKDNVTSVSVTHYNDTNGNDLLIGSGPYNLTVNGPINQQVFDTDVLSADMEYGFIKLSLQRRGLTCLYHKLYTFKVTYANGDVEQRNVTLIIIVPDSKYVSSLNASMFVIGHPQTVVFEGYLGCFPSIINIDQKPENKSQILLGNKYDQSVIMEWKYPNISDKDSSKNIQAYVAFRPPYGTSNIVYQQNYRINVLDETWCNKANFDYTDKNDCQIRNPNDSGSFISCSRSKKILAVSKCPPGLVFKEDPLCVDGKCDYP